MSKEPYYLTRMDDIVLYFSNHIHTLHNNYHNYIDDDHEDDNDVDLLYDDNDNVDVDVNDDYACRISFGS